MPLNSWDAANAGLCLASDGDGIEREACRIGLLGAFPNYEIFWKRFVAPATGRPANSALRPGASRALSSMAIISHSLLTDLFTAAIAQGKVAAGDFGEVFQNATASLLNDGNALQKFRDMQEAIKELGNELGRRLVLWPDAVFVASWAPRRARAIVYRNVITHFGRPAIAERGGEVVVLHPDFVTQNMTWQEQETLLRSEPHKAARLADVCDLVHRDTLAWLNDAYADMIGFLAPVRANASFIRLLGWNLAKPGPASWNVQTPSAPPIAVGHQGLSTPARSIGDVSGKSTIS